LTVANAASATSAVQAATALNMFRLPNICGRFVLSHRLLGVEPLYYMTLRFGLSERQAVHGRC
jgi:hypothetical protein